MFVVSFPFAWFPCVAFLSVSFAGLASNKIALQLKKNIPLWGPL